MNRYIFFFLKLFVTFSAALFFLSAPAAGAESREYRIKAAFIYNFLKFVEWPSGTQAADSTAINLCIMGDDPFGGGMDSVRGKAVGNRAIAIKYASSVSSARNCQILFIAGSEKSRLPQIIESLRASNILTVGDTEGFARLGVIINMYMEHEKIRFEVNLRAARLAGLRIDSRLLRLARIVQE